MDSTGSKSLLDYGLIDAHNVHSVNSFVIDEQARYAAGSDHALLECSVVVRRTPKLTWCFKESLTYNIHDNTNFDSYKVDLDEAMKSIPVLQFNQMKAEAMLPHIAESINKSAKKTLGIKTDKKKRGRQLPPTLIQKIKEKNDLIKSLDTGIHPNDTVNYTI